MQTTWVQGSPPLLFYLKIPSKIGFILEKHLFYLANTQQNRSVRTTWVQGSPPLLFYLKILNKSVLSSKSIYFISQVLNKIDPCGLRGYKARLLFFIFRFFWVSEIKSKMGGKIDLNSMKFEWRSISHPSRQQAASNKRLSNCLNQLRYLIFIPQNKQI